MKFKTSLIGCITLLFPSGFAAMAQSAASEYTGGFSGLYRPLTLAAAAAKAQGAGGAGVDDEKARAAELAKKLENPVASLISVPIQNIWDFGIGPANAMRYTANIQPVIPFSISEDWSVITRTIVPIIYAESPAAANFERLMRCGCRPSLAGWKSAVSRLPVLTVSATRACFLECACMPSTIGPACSPLAQSPIATRLRVLQL